MQASRLLAEQKRAEIEEGMRTKLSPERLEKVSIHVRTMSNGLTELRIRSKVREGRNGERAVKDG